jgi:trigger factor
MKIELTDQDAVKRRMDVEIEPERVAEETEKVLRGYASKARIPGFRPGKAPLSVVRARFAKEVREDVRDRLVSRSFREAAAEKGLQPLGDPILEEVSHEEGQPLRFKTRFEVLPRIEVKNHKGVEVRQPDESVTDADVEKALDELRDARARLEVVEGHAAGTGDVLIADVKGRPEDGEPFERERMFIEIGATDNLPAFNEKLEGATAGAQLAFSTEYPEEHPNTDLAGKRVEYELSVHEVKRRVVPELNDDFARDLGEFGSLEDLRKRVREDLEHRKKHEAERAVRQAVLDKVLLENPTVLPDTLVDSEIRYRLEEIVRRLMMQGMDPEKVQLDWKALRDQQEEPARKAVHARLVLDAVARAESVEVTDEEMEQRLRRDAEALGQKVEKFRAELRKQGGVEVVKNQLLREKSLDLLTSVANIRREE